MVIIILAMEYVWLLVCTCAAFEFSVLKRLLSFLDVTTSLSLSWPYTWTIATSHTLELRRTHLCPQTNQRLSTLPQIHGTQTPNNQTKGPNNQTPSRSSTRGATVAIALLHLPQCLQIPHSTVPPHLAHGPDTAELTVTTRKHRRIVRHGLMATVNQMR